MAIAGATAARRRTRIVGLGGGTGLSVLLSGLKAHAQRHGAKTPLDISAIVSVADDGGSSGTLRREFDIPALGDLRACLVAASRGNAVWRDLFQHRFAGGDGLEGHALGNLVMAAMLERSGGLSSALEQLAEPLRLCARVLPATEERVTLSAELDDGSVVCGESVIPSRGRRIERLWLEPESPAPARGVLEALANADAIVLGPGSLYTSVIVNLLVDGVAEAIRASSALRIFVCNLWTQAGETDGLDAAGHLAALERYLGPGCVDVCLVSAASADAARTTGPAGAAVALASPTDFVRGALAGAVPIVADLASDTAPHRHDPEKLAMQVVSLARNLRRPPLTAEPPARRSSAWMNTPPPASAAIGAEASARSIAEVE